MNPDTTLGNIVMLRITFRNGRVEFRMNNALLIAAALLDPPEDWASALVMRIDKFDSGLADWIYSV